MERIQYENNMENSRLATEFKNARTALLYRHAGLDRPVMNPGGELPDSLQVLRMSNRIVGRISEGVIGIDDEGLIVIANRAARHILGNEPGQLPGCCAADVLPERLWRYFVESKGKPCAEARLGLTDDQPIKSRYFDFNPDESLSGGVLMLARGATVA